MSCVHHPYVSFQANVKDREEVCFCPSVFLSCQPFFFPRLCFFFFYIYSTIELFSGRQLQSSLRFIGGLLVTLVSGSLNYMPYLMNLIKENGAYFPNAYTSTPICCPSRSSMLTGLYIHNHEVQWLAVMYILLYSYYLVVSGYCGHCLYNSNILSCANKQTELSSSVHNIV